MCIYIYIYIYIYLYIYLCLFLDTASHLDNKFKSCNDKHRVTKPLFTEIKDLHVVGRLPRNTVIVSPETQRIKIMQQSCTTTS